MPETTAEGYRPTRKHGVFKFKAPWWMIRAIFEESDRQATPPALLVVSVLREYFTKKGYGPQKEDK